MGFFRISNPNDGAQLKTLIAPAAAVYLFDGNCGDSNLRRMARAGQLPSATVTGWGGKDSRFFDFDSLCDRFGEPDPSRLQALRQFSYVHGDDDAAGNWTLIVKPPRLSGGHNLDSTKPRRVLAVDEIGRLAIYEKD